MTEDDAYKVFANNRRKKRFKEAYERSKKTVTEYEKEKELGNS